MHITGIMLPKFAITWKDIIGEYGTKRCGKYSLLIRSAKGANGAVGTNKGTNGEILAVG